jgi:hypothetical protein
MTPVLGQRARPPHHGGRPLSLVCSISIGEGRYTIQFARAICDFCRHNARNSNITVHSRPGLDDARFRVTRPFLSSWWMTAALISFRFLRQGEIYDSFDLGHVMGFSVGLTYFCSYYATPHTTIINF